MWVFSLLPLLLFFFFYFWLLPEDLEDVEGFAIDTVLRYNVITVFFNVSLQTFIFFLFKHKPTFFNTKRKKTQCPGAATESFSIKKVVFLPEIKTGSFSKKFRYPCLTNKLRSNTFHWIFKYSTEHLKDQATVDSCLLKIEKNSIIFP